MNMNSGDIAISGIAAINALSAENEALRAENIALMAERNDLHDELAEISAQNGELCHKNVELNAQLRYKDAENTILRHDLNEAYDIIRRMKNA